MKSVNKILCNFLMYMTNINKIADDANKLKTNMLNMLYSNTATAEKLELSLRWLVPHFMSSGLKA